MGVLGRGLASLIPKRDREVAEETLDQIDQMEFEVEAVAAVPEAKVNKRQLSVMEDFEELEKVESMPMPTKPMVTPLTFDPFEAEGGAKVVLERKHTEEASSVPVTEAVEEKVELVRGDAFTESEMVTPVADEPTSLDEDVPKAEEVGPEVVASVTEGAKPDEDWVAAETVEEVKPEAVEAVVAPIEAKEEVVAPAASAVPDAAVINEDDSENWDKHEQSVVHVAIGDIKINPLQPRRTFNPEDLDDLMRSIEQHGILQPLVVRRLPGTEGYELIAGERRLRASKKLGWDKVPAVIRRDVKSDQSRLVFALIENIQRENLNPVEEALAYKQLNEEYGLTHEEIGERVGKSRVAITNIVRILQLPTEIQRGLTEGKITTGHAKAILMIPDEDKQIKFYRHLVDEGLTVRKAEVRARRIQRTMNLHDPLRRRSGNKHPLALKYSPALEERYGYDAQLKFLEEVNRFEVTFKAHSEAEVVELVGRLMGTQEMAPKVDDE